MTKIAVLGANGQVGAELCLILKNHPDIELIPICRNRGGSAFLRYYGIRCRHGLPADPEQAASLFGDCDIVINCTLGNSTPKQIRKMDHALITNSVAFSPPHAKIIYFSTLMVHGNPYPDAWVRWRSAYGRAKLRSERLLRARCASAAKKAFIFRLGHVCGELQNITADIRERIRTRNVFLPPDDRPSNTVYTCTIADAILQVAAGKEKPGTYDLVSFPEWSWQEVYAYEAEQCEVPLEPKIIQVPVRRKLLGMLGVSALRSLPSKMLSNPLVKELTLRTMAYASGQLNERFQAKWHQMRAKAEIQALRQAEQGEPPHEALTWVAMGRVFLSTLTPTRKLLNQAEFRIAKRDPNLAWPADLPLASD